VEPDRADDHWATPAADSAVSGLDTVRARYRRWQRRHESVLGRASRKVRWIAERRLARPAPAQDRLTPWWMWAVILGTVETVGRSPWFLDLAPASSVIAQLVSDFYEDAPGWLDGLPTEDSVFSWLTDRIGASPAAVVCHPLVLVACTVALRRTRRLPRVLRTVVVAPAGIVGLVTAVSYGWHLLVTRFEPLAMAVTGLSPVVTIAVVALTPLLVRGLAGRARRI
jgi:hypothetical protein